MKKRNIKKNRLFIKLLFLVVASILMGIFYMAVLSKTNRNLVGSELKTFFSSLEKISYHKAFLECFSSNFFLLIFMWLLGISIIGIPLILLILLYKGFILGFSVSSILYFYHWKGILISIIYCFPLLIELFAFLFLGYYSIQFSKKLNQLLFLKKEISFRHIMRRYSKMFLFSMILVLVGSLIEIYIVPSILGVFKI